MNCIYIFMCGITEKVTFPFPLDMEGKGCALFLILEVKKNHLLMN